MIRFLNLAQSICTRHQFLVQLPKGSLSRSLDWVYEYRYNDILSISVISVTNHIYLSSLPAQEEQLNLERYLFGVVYSSERKESLDLE